MQEIQPDEIYNLAAQSHVQVSFETPEYTANADALGHAAAAGGDPHPRARRDRRASTRPRPRSFTARSQETPQRETTPFYPRSPYAAAKLYAYWITVNYREAYGMHASNGILFNHEGPIRGETFVTRKITRAVAAIQPGLQDKLYLGNLDAKRDWGHARDYVEGMWLILQQDEPDDYVLATGETHSVREFVELAFAEIGRAIDWRGKGVDEAGRRRQERRACWSRSIRAISARPKSTAAGRPAKAQRRAGLEARAQLRGAGARNGGGRPGRGRRGAAQRNAE